MSGLLWQGPPRKLIDAGRTQRITLVTSQDLLAELAEVLAREKFASRIQQAQLSAKTLVEDYATIAQVVTSARLDRPVTRATRTTMRSSPARWLPALKPSSLGTTICSHLPSIAGSPF